MFNAMITQDVHDFIEPYIQGGDCVVDLTMGNGHDTLYLAQKVGEGGKVYGFDIQDIALQNTRELLESHQVTWASLIRDGHQQILDYIKEPIGLAVMNLGYLPGADKTLVTQGTSTIKAIEGTLSLLKTKGVMSVTAYVGHAGSYEEVDLLKTYLSNLSAKSYSVREIAYVNRQKTPPIIYMIQKK